ncbi:MAG: hypothetical protein ACT4OK_21915 [Gemmobacter sp.]
MAPSIQRRDGYLGAWHPATVLDFGAGFAVLSDPLSAGPIFYRIARSAGRPKATELRPVGAFAPVSLAPADDGWASVSLVADGPEAQFWIESDGTSSNLVGNPSFERGLVGWDGADPGAAGSVTRATGRAFAGDAAMRMVLAPSPAGTRIARTLRIEAAALGSAVLSLRAATLVAGARGAQVEMRLIAKDAGGADVFFASTRAVDAEAVDYAPLVIEGARLPAETASVEVQLTILARADGATGTVLWDAVELRPQDRLPPA